MNPPISRNNFWSPKDVFEPGLTPYGYYDTDPRFAQDGDRFAYASARKMGWPHMAVELDAASFYTALEEAATRYATEVYNFKVRDQYASFEGVPSGSVDPEKQVVIPTLASIIRMAKVYGAEAGAGGNVTYYTGSLPLKAGQQVYDLDEWAAASGSLVEGDHIEIKRVFHQRTPAINRIFDPTTFSGIGMGSFLDGFGLGGFSPAMNFMMVPLNLDALRIQAVELNDEIRRSHYSFELINNKLRVIPVPGEDGNLFFHYIKESERSNPTVTLPEGAITNPSQVPYKNFNYSALNAPARNWILDWGYTLALYMLANVRGKYASGVPFAQTSQQLNSADLRVEADRRQDDLLTQLREMLESTSSRAQLERQAQQAQLMNSTLSNVPLPIFIG